MKMITNLRRIKQFIRKLDLTEGEKLQLVFVDDKTEEWVFNMYSRGNEIWCDEERPEETVSEQNELYIYYSDNEYEEYLTIHFIKDGHVEFLNSTDNESLNFVRIKNLLKFYNIMEKARSIFFM